MDSTWQTSWEKEGSTLSGVSTLRKGAWTSYYKATETVNGKSTEVVIKTFSVPEEIVEDQERIASERAKFLEAARLQKELTEANSPGARAWVKVLRLSEDPRNPSFSMEKCGPSARDLRDNRAQLSAKDLYQLVDSILLGLMELKGKKNRSHGNIKLSDVLCALPGQSPCYKLADPAAKGRGVLVLIDDDIHSAHDVIKRHTTDVATFSSGEAGLVGAALFGKNIWYRSPAQVNTTKSEFSIPANQTTLPRVDIIYAHANMSPDLITAAARNGAKGIVIAGVGDGNMTAPAWEALKQVVKQGVVGVRSSRTTPAHTMHSTRVPMKMSSSAVPRPAHVIGSARLANNNAPNATHAPAPTPTVSRDSFLRGLAARRDSQIQLPLRIARHEASVSSSNNTRAGSPPNCAKCRPITQRRSVDIAPGWLRVMSAPVTSLSCTISVVIDVSLMSRLSVLTVTRKRSRRSMPMGCSAIEPTTPVFMFDVGHSSSGMRRSRTYAARRPSFSSPGGPVMSSTMRTPCPSRSAPQ